MKTKKTSLPVPASVLFEIAHSLQAAHGILDSIEIALHLKGDKKDCFDGAMEKLKSALELALSQSKKGARV